MDQKQRQDIAEQKDEELIYTYNRELFYHFDREKGFTQQVAYQNPNNQVIIKQSWDEAELRMEEIRQQVIAGKLSPIAYHMERILMEVPMLAAYTGFSKWRVKRHLKPKIFRNLGEETLKHYASVFGITIDELKNFNIMKKH